MVCANAGRSVHSSIMATLASPLAIDGLVPFADCVRADAARQLNGPRRSALGQFFTPAPVASLLASMTRVRGDTVRVLDPGAGSGILSAAWVAAACSGSHRPRRIELVAHEVDGALLPPLRATLDACVNACSNDGIEMEFRIENSDFLAHTVERL